MRECCRVAADISFLGDFENMLIVWMDGGMDGWMIIGGRRSDLYLYVHVCMYVCMYVHVCVYACMYVRTYVCMYKCVYVSIKVCVHECMHLCMYVCMHVFMYVCMYICMHECKNACMYICMNARTYKCAFMNPYLHFCKMYKCMYVCVCLRFWCIYDVCLCHCVHVSMHVWIYIR